PAEISIHRTAWRLSSTRFEVVRAKAPGPPPPSNRVVRVIAPSDCRTATGDPEEPLGGLVVLQVDQGPRWDWKAGNVNHHKIEPEGRHRNDNERGDQLQPTPPANRCGACVRGSLFEPARNFLLHRRPGPRIAVRTEESSDFLWCEGPPQTPPAPHVDAFKLGGLMPVRDHPRLRRVR